MRNEKRETRNESENTTFYKPEASTEWRDLRMKPDSKR